MRALLRSLSVALTILLVSTTANAQITGSEPKPGEPTQCPTIIIEPARGMCPGWEVARNCTQTVVTVVIDNTTACAVPFLRIGAMPHSQGMNFAICAPGYRLSRPNCSTDPIHIALDDKPLQPGERIELQFMADREGDIMVETMCRETFQRCSVPAHIPMFPSPYPQDGGGTPTQPTEPYQPAPDPTTGSEPAPVGQDPAPVVSPSDGSGSGSPYLKESGGDTSNDKVIGG
jgi:hypothetical protein